MLLAGAGALLSSCCQEPPADMITYTRFKFLVKPVTAVTAGNEISATFRFGTEHIITKGDRKKGTCYHKSLLIGYSNPFDSSKFVLQLNKPVILNGTTIPAYSNLAKLSSEKFKFVKYNWNPPSGYFEDLILTADTGFAKFPYRNSRVIIKNTTFLNEVFTDSTDFIIN